MKKELQKKLSFVLFVMAVFFAGVVLTAFHSSVLLICIAGVVLLAATVYYVLLLEEKSQSPTEKTTELLFADRLAELIRGNEKAEKGVYIAVKKQHEAMEAGLTALEEKFSELIKSHENAVKTLVLYNKENAKQMALSEREELGRLCDELKQLQQGDKGAQGSMSSVVDAIKEMSHRLYEEYHENGEAMLSELETAVDSLDEIKELLKQSGENRMSHQIVTVPLSGAESGMAEPESVEEPEAVAEKEPTAEEKPEDALASSGVDLSDPNKTLSPDDIAALIAALGN